MVLIFWRPKGINEAIPATIGAILIFLCGSVSLADIGDIGSKVTGAALPLWQQWLWPSRWKVLVFFIG